MKHMTLAEATALYWNVSSIREGRLDGGLTVEGALTQTGKALQHLGPKRKLHNKLVHLREDIIQGSKPKAKTKAKTTPKNKVTKG